MKDDYIFFSYSRVDSPFVLDLATKLRDAGGNVWLDQIDIPVGARWDSEIERALEKSNTLLVILSKNSVDSHNVLDEVSFALEENKKVIPVLLEECEIPFRLRRFQYVDFTGDPQKGFEALSRALDNDDKTAENISKISSVNKSQDTPQPPPKPQPKPENLVGNNTSKQTISVDTNGTTSAAKKYMMIGIPVAILICLGLYMMFMKGDQIPSDPTPVTDTKVEESPIAETPVIDTVPAIPELTPEQIEASDWEDALAENTEEGYYVFRNKHPESKYVAETDIRINDIKSWEKVDADDLESNAEYIISSTENSSFKEEAWANINALAGLKVGWVYAGKTSGEKAVANVFELLCCDHADGKEIPKSGDIIKNASVSLFTYQQKNNTAGGDANKSRRTGSITNGQYGIVEEVDNANGTMRLKIKY